MLMNIVNNGDISTIAVESSEFDRFMHQYKSNCYDGQRLGQAFYNHFRLHKMNHTHHDAFHRLYEKDGDEARALLGQMVVLQ